MNKKEKKEEKIQKNWAFGVLFERS